MKSKYLLIIVLLVFTACKHTVRRQQVIEKTWIKQSLPNGWELYTPPNFECKQLQGIDSQPGYIFSKKDSITLKFDSGLGLINKLPCSIEKRYLEEKSDIDTGFYNHFYHVPSVHSAQIDEVDNRIVITITPVKTGHGTVGIEFKNNCDSKAWLGITGVNLNKAKEQLVLKIFKTIRQRDKN